MVCISLSKSALGSILFPSDIAKLGKKKPMEEDSSTGVKYLKVLRKVFRFFGLFLEVFARFLKVFESFLKVF